MIAADPVTGLVMGFSHFRHPLTNLPYKVIHTDGSTTETTKENFRFNPFDPAPHYFDDDLPVIDWDAFALRRTSLFPERQRRNSVA